jgi:hypothetical protein
MQLKGVCIRLSSLPAGILIYTADGVARGRLEGFLPGPHIICQLLVCFKHLIPSFIYSLIALLK